MYTDLREKKGIQHMEDVLIIIFCLACGLMGFVIGYCLGYEEGIKKK